MKKISEGVFGFGKDFATESIAPKHKVYDEKIIRQGKREYRVWNPKKSKLGAAIKKGLSHLPLNKKMKILYLGIASGTTASHISDIVSESGIIYGVEISSRPLRDLMSVSKKRKNMIPILADARLPETFANRIEKVNLIYEDVAQKDQTEILIRNAEVFLKKGGYAMIAIKARSIDVTKKPKVVFNEAREKLEKKFRIIQQINLEPYEKDHCFFLLKYLD